VSATRTSTSRPISATATGRAIFRLFDYQRFLAKGDIIQHFNGFATVLVFDHFHETESFAFTGFPVHSHLG
jgi:hypothetical protein